MNKYKVINGTSYNQKTPQAVVNVLEAARVTKVRLKLYYGDIATGIDWVEEHDTIGYIGRSNGTIKIPLLIHNSRSTGGGALLDNCIIKIKESKGNKILYQAYNYQAPILEIKECGSLNELYKNGKIYSTHDTKLSAIRLKNKLS